MSKQYDNTNRGALFRNEEKKSDKHPDYSGSLNVDGAEFFLDAWINEAASGRKFMSVSIKAKTGPKPTGKTHGQMAEERRRPAPSDDDDIPF